jgi:tetratricopeptide (TPR) repeat protein
LRHRIIGSGGKRSVRTVLPFSRRLVRSAQFLVVGALLASYPAPAPAQKAEDVYNEGTVLLAAGKTAEAIAQFRQAIQLSPNLAAAHFNLGAAYEQQGALAEAIAAYQEAVKYKPESKYYLSLGLACKKKGMLAEAIAAYLKAAEASPQDPRVFFNLGNAYLEKNALTEAIANYEKALKLKYPTPAAVYLNAGIAHQKQGNKTEAIKAYEAYLKAVPQAANAKQIREIVGGLRGGAAN